VNCADAGEELLKIAHVFPFYGVNGMDRYIASLDRNMKGKSGLSLVNFVVVQQEQLPLLRKVEYFDEASTIIVVSKFSPQTKINIVADCLLPEVEKEFRAFLADNRPDVVNFQHLSDLGASLIGIAKDMGVRTVVTCHDYWAICPRNFLVNYRLESCYGPNNGSNCFSCYYPESGASAVNDPGQFLLRYKFVKEMFVEKADLIITVSASMRDRFIYEGIPGEKIKTIYPSVEPAKKIDQQERDNNRLHIGFVGHWTPIKGPHILIEAFKRVQRPDVHLYLYGTEEPLFRSTLIELANDLENIHFCGAYKPTETSDVYANLDLLVAPSICPEQPLVILEAFQYGVPVIGSNLGGIPEYLDSQCGLLFEPGNIEDLADKLQTVLDRPELIDEWKSRIPTWQTPGEMSDLIYEEYRKLSEHRKPAPTLSNDHTLLLQPHNKGFLRKQVFPVQLQKLVGELKKRGATRIALFPAMVDAATIAYELANHHIVTACFIDNSASRRNTSMDDIPVYLPDEFVEIQRLRPDLIIVASSHEASIKRQLESADWNIPYIGFNSL
jgi:glycosyltransferase involved in cell wall biosynthesis